MTEKEKNPYYKLETLLNQAQITIPRYVSSYDIKRAGIDWKSLTQEEKNNHLWDVGLDVRNRRYITYVDTHVAWDGTRVRCVRTICQERTDKEWIQSGLASDDAYKVHKSDSGMNAELEKLSNCYLKPDYSDSRYKVILDKHRSTKDLD